MHEIVVTEENFAEVVLQADRPVLVDFWAPWCGPCKMIAPSISQLAERYSETLTVAKLNVDDAETVASNYNVNSIPTLMIFKGGEVVGQRMGAASYAVIEAFVKEHL